MKVAGTVFLTTKFKMATLREAFQIFVILALFEISDI